MYSCELRIYNVLCNPESARLQKIRDGTHGESLYFDYVQSTNPPAKTIPILQQQSDKNNLNNINLLEMSLEKKEAMVMLFCIFSAISKVTKKKEM